jgi:hypothetical protein
VRTGLALIVLAVNVVAIFSILGTRTAAGRKTGWTAAVVLLPLIGAAGWFLRGRGGATHRKARRRGRSRRRGPAHGAGRGMQ